MGSAWTEDLNMCVAQGCCCFVSFKCLNQPLRPDNVDTVCCKVSRETEKGPRAREQCVPPAIPMRLSSDPPSINTQQR